MGITPYLTKERVGNKICPGTERENFKPGTTGTESIRTDKKDTTDNATHV